MVVQNDRLQAEPFTDWRKSLYVTALWAIVNNAGIAGINFPFEWTSKEDVQKTLDVNLLGVYDVTLAFLPLIKTGKEGCHYGCCLCI